MSGCQDDTLGLTLGSLKDSQQASQSQIPQLEGYELRRELGRGTFGVVWEAIRLQTGQKVAIKLVLHEQRLHWSYFGRELDLLVDLEDHPYMLTVLDADLAHQPPYLVTPLVEGGSLLNHPQASLATRVAWIEQMAEALQHIHSKGVIHCDLKPSNILVSHRDSIRIGDLGQSRRLLEGEVAYGTIGYMAPEQCAQLSGRRSAPSVLWDVYGFGATAYWILTGQRPRLRLGLALSSSGSVEQQVAEYLRALQEQPLEPILALNPQVDPALASIVEHCLALVPQERTSTMEEVVEDLKRRRRGERLLCRRPWTLGYQLRYFLTRPWFQGGVLLLLLLGLAALRALGDFRQRQFELLTQSGLHALETGRIEEAYLRWLGALKYRPSDRTTRARLAFLPIAMSYPGMGEVQSLAFSNDGSLLATGEAPSSHQGGSANLWEAESGRLLLRIGHRDSVVQVALASSNPWLACTSLDGSATVYDYRQNRLRFRLSHPRGLQDLQFSGDEQKIVTSDQAAQIQVWDSRSGARLPLLSDSVQDLLKQAFDCKPDRPMLAGLSNSRTVRLWDLASGKPLRDLVQSQPSICLDFHPHQPWLAVGGDRGLLQVWHIETGRLLAQDIDESGRLNALRFDPQGRWLAGARDNGTATLWQVSDWSQRQFYHPRPLLNLAFDSQGSMLALGMGDKQSLWSLHQANGGVRVWSTASGLPLSEILSHDGPVHQVAFRPRSASPERPTAWGQETPPFAEVAAVSGSGWRVSAVHPGVARLWQLSLPLLGPPRDRTLLDPQSQFLQGGSRFRVESHPRKGLLLSDAASSRIQVVSHGEGVAIDAWAFSPDGQWLLTGGQDRTARLWALPDFRPHLPLLPHPGAVTAVACSPDGRWLASAAANQDEYSIRLWDAADGSPISPPLYCQELVRQLSFSADLGQLWANQGRYHWSILPPAEATDSDLAQHITSRLRAHLDPNGMLLGEPSPKPRESL